MDCYPKRTQTRSGGNTKFNGGFVKASSPRQIHRFEHNPLAAEGRYHLEKLRVETRGSSEIEGRHLRPRPASLQVSYEADMTQVHCIGLSLGAPVGDDQDLVQFCSSTCVMHSRFQSRTRLCAANAQGCHQTSVTSGLVTK